MHCLWWSHWRWNLIKCFGEDTYVLPLIGGICSHLSKARFITGLDLKDSFLQISLDDVSKTASGRLLYQFVTMQRWMAKVTLAHLRHELFAYLIIEAVVKHLLLRNEMILCLSRAGLTINIRKSEFGMTGVRYLKHITGNGKAKCVLPMISSA